MSGIISSILYAQSDAHPKSLRNDSDLQEKLIARMEIPETGVSEDRIAALEKRVRDMEALIRGLVEEFLDFKAVAMTMSRQSDERNRQDLKQGPVVRGTTSQVLAGPPVSFPGTPPADGSTLIRPRGTRQPDVPAAPAEPVMVRIMQNDGTMKLEPRMGDRNPIDSASGYGRNKMGAALNARQAPLIYAADEEKPGTAKR